MISKLIFFNQRGDIMELKKGLTYTLIGIGLIAGAMATYYKYGNGNLTYKMKKAKNQVKDKLENMM